MGSRLAVHLAMDEVDDLGASVAAEANHRDEAKIMGALDAVYDRLSCLERTVCARRTGSK